MGLWDHWEEEKVKIAHQMWEVKIWNPKKFQGIRDARKANKEFVLKLDDKVSTYILKLEAQEFNLPRRNKYELFWKILEN